MMKTSRHAYLGNARRFYREFALETSKVKPRERERKRLERR